MKAAVIHQTGHPEVLVYEDVPDPELPPGCVAIDVEAVSIEGGDLLARAGGDIGQFPHVVGYLCAGTVSAVGDGVEGIPAGSRVIGLNMAGSHAEKRVVPAIMTWPVPDGLDPAVAATIPVAFGTAHECLFTAGGLEKGNTALIHAGAGGLGMAAIQLAVQAGATVIATASSDAKLERLKDLFGLDHGINYAGESFVERVAELTDGKGADVVLDSVGGTTLTDSVEALAYRGRIASVGVAGRSGSEIEARTLWQKNNALYGVFLGGAILAEYPRIHPMIAEMIERVARGELHVEIDRRFELAEAAEAHAYIEGRNAFGRVVLIP